MTKFGLLAICTSAGIGCSLIFAASPASALVIDISLTGQTGISTSSRTFTNGGVSLTFAPTAGSLQRTGIPPQSYVTSAGTGLCLYANSNGAGNPSAFLPCGLTTASSSNVLTYNNIGVTANKSIVFKGGTISQLSVPSGGVGSPDFGNIEVRYVGGSSVLGTIATTSTGTFTFSAPIALNLGQELLFTGSGTNSSVRLSSFTVEDAPVPPVPVPGPLPLLGAAAAFGWSRKLRKRIKLTP